MTKINALFFLDDLPYFFPVFGTQTFENWTYAGLEPPSSKGLFTIHPNFQLVGVQKQENNLANRLKLPRIFQKCVELHQNHFGVIKIYKPPPKSKNTAIFGFRKKPTWFFEPIFGAKFFFRCQKKKILSFLKTVKKNLAKLVSDIISRIWAKTRALRLPC